MRQFLFVLMATSLFFITPAYSYAEAVHGVLRVVKGQVQIKAAKDGKTTRAKVGQKVFPLDTIITGADSRAKVVMIDNNEINVSPDSEVAFEKYEYKPGENKKDVLLNVIYGKVRSKVEQKYDGKTTKFQVKTPSAVAGVRGTDFITGYDSSTKTTSVVTFTGAVELKTLSGGAPVMVTMGQTATAVPGKAPTPPAPIPESDLKSIDLDSDAGPSASTDGASGSSVSGAPVAAEESSSDSSASNESQSSAPAASTAEVKSEDSKPAATLGVDKSDVPEVKEDARAPASTPGTPESSAPAPAPRPEIVKPNVAVAPPAAVAPVMPTVPVVTIPEPVKDIMQNSGPSKVNIIIRNQ